ncbi:MAG: enoyl-CoA hydratase/isomerase family protein [Nitrospirae bacterium]|nr:enoyl-CoA hydratase/isomerase family protein [Nitrospirota bacterium]
MPAIRQYNGFKIEVNEITLLTFNNPKVNLFSTPLLNDFIAALEAIRTSKVKVVVITGEGNTFMAGADIREMSEFTPGQATDFSRLFHAALNSVEEFPLPVIAGVNGFALGGGCELMLVCDIVIASESAVFGQPEVNLGIIPGAGGTQRLAVRIGKMRAKELIFTGRRVNAQEALTIGLINKIVPKDELMREVMSLAETIASKPLQCLEASKSLINSGSLEKEIETFGLLFSCEDQKRLMRDFLDRKSS